MKRQRSAPGEDTVVDIHDDAGLQPERTTLAWVRTAALAVAVCLLFIRTVPGPGVLVVGAAAAAAFPALAILATARRNHRLRVREFVDGRAPIHLGPALAVSTGVVLLACAAASLLLTQPSS